MPQYDNTNRGVLFINNNKKSDKSPTVMGKIDIEGTEYYLSGWTNYKRGDGEKYLSLSVTPIEEGQRTQSPADALSPNKFDDDISY